MSGAYYNENNAHAAAWLRELIKAGLIADGEVDERSITDIASDDLRGFVQCHFFAGIGGWSYALRLAGWPDDRPVWTGSCPCQPFSQGGTGAGGQDKRHLWPVWFALIEKREPSTCFGEQVAGTSGLSWLDAISTDLERSGYAFAAADLSASFRKPHRRNRLFWVADATDKRSSSSGQYVRELSQESEVLAEWVQCNDGRRRPVEPGTFPLAHGIPARVGRLRGYGNAIVPQVAAAFIEAYMSVTA